MKKIPDVYDALIRKVADKLLALYKNKDPHFVPLFEYMFARAFTAASNQPDNLLSNIKCTYEINSLSALAELLKKIYTGAASETIHTALNSVMQITLVNLFPEPLHLIAYINNLLIYDFELSQNKSDQNGNIQYILALLVKLFCSMKQYQQSLITFLKDLLAERKRLPDDLSSHISSDSKNNLLLEHKLLTLCNSFEEVKSCISMTSDEKDLASRPKEAEGPTSISMEDIQYLFMLFARRQDVQTYLRGNSLFDVKIVHFFTEQEVKRLFVNEPRVIARQCELIINLITSATEEQIKEFQLKDKSDKKDSLIHRQIADSTQSFLDWLLAFKPEQLISKNLLMVCQWIIHEMLINKKMPRQNVVAYVAGVIFLRMLNPAIINLNVTIKDPIRLSIVKRQLLNISIIIQGLANQTGKEGNQSTLSSAQLALLASEENRKMIREFLGQFFSHLPVHQMSADNSMRRVVRPVDVTRVVSKEKRLSLHRNRSGTEPFIRPIIEGASMAEQSQSSPIPRSRSTTLINQISDKLSDGGANDRRSIDDTDNKEQKLQPRAMPRSITADNLKVLQTADQIPIILRPVTSNADSQSVEKIAELSVIPCSEPSSSASSSATSNIELINSAGHKKNGSQASSQILQENAQKLIKTEKNSAPQPPMIGKPSIIAKENLQLDYINLMLNAWYETCKEQLDLITKGEESAAAQVPANNNANSLGMFKVLFRTALPTINHALVSLTAMVLRQDDLVQLYNVINYYLTIYKNGQQRLMAKMLSRNKMTITTDQVKWQGEGQEQIVIDHLAQLASNDTSTLNIVGDTPIVSPQNAEIKKTTVNRNEAVSKLPECNKTWQEILDELKKDAKSNDEDILLADQELTERLTQLQALSEEHNNNLKAHNEKIASIIKIRRDIINEIAMLRQKMEDKNTPKPAAAVAATELLKKRNELQKATPSITELLKIKEDLMHYQNAAYYTKQQLENCKLDVKIAPLSRLKAEVLKLAAQCQMRGLYENAASKTIVTSARVPGAK